MAIKEYVRRGDSLAGERFFAFRYEGDTAPLREHFPQVDFITTPSGALIITDRRKSLFAMVHDWIVWSEATETIVLSDETFRECYKETF